MTTKSLCIFSADGGLQSPSFSEDYKAEHVIDIVSVGFNNIGSGCRCSVDGGVNRAVNARGMQLLVFSSDLVFESVTTFDTYAQEATRGQLSEAIKAVPADKYFALVTHDAFRTDDKLNATMTALNCIAWNKLVVPYLSDSTIVGNFRSCYAFFGKSDGSMVYESFSDSLPSTSHAYLTVILNTSAGMTDKVRLSKFAFGVGTLIESELETHVKLGQVNVLAPSITEGGA